MTPTSEFNHITDYNLLMCPGTKMATVHKPILYLFVEYTRNADLEREGKSITIYIFNCLRVGNNGVHWWKNIIYIWDLRRIVDCTNVHVLHEPTTALISAFLQERLTWNMLKSLNRWDHWLREGSIVSVTWSHVLQLHSVILKSPILPLELCYIYWLLIF